METSNTDHEQPLDCSHPQCYSLKKLGMRKHGILAQITDVPIRGMISVGPDSQVSIHRKALNSLT